MESASVPIGGRSVLARSPMARLPDRALKYGLTALAVGILALIVYFFIRLVGEARPAFTKAGVIGFTFDNDWNVNGEQFGALPLLVGTLITSGLALLMGVPIAVAAAMLGLGRAIGETIAVTILIGDAPQLGKHLFGQGYSLAAVIANEFGEAQGLHRSALFAAGLVLFLLTLLVNAAARVLVHRAARGRGAVAGGGEELVGPVLAERAAGM